MIKIFAITIFFVCFCNNGFSQLGRPDELRDSLKHELVIAKNDTSRVLIMVDLANAYFVNRSDSLILYGNRALELAQRIKFSRGEASALNALGVGFQFQGDYPKSLEYLYRSLQIAEEKNYVFETANCYTWIGNAYWFLGDYLKEIDFCKKSQNLLETIINKQGVRELMLFNILEIGQGYLEYHLDSAYHYLSQYYDATLQDKYAHPLALYNLGDCLFRQGDHQTSFDYVRESIAGSVAVDDYVTQAEACAVISGFFKTMHHPDSAIYYAKKGLAAANSIGYKLGIYKNSKLLAEEYELSNVQQALYYRKIYDSVNESTYGAKKVQELQKTLAEEQQRQQKIQEEQIKKEGRLKEYGFIAGLAIMLLIAFILYRNNLQKKKANVLLQHQKEKVESTLGALNIANKQLENKNRDLEIEAALEKVRSRSLTMHSSTELREVVNVVFEELQALNITTDGGATITTSTKNSKELTAWITDPHTSSLCLNVPYPQTDLANHSIISDFWKAKENGIDHYSKEYSFEEKNTYFRYVFSINEYIPDEVRNWLLERKNFAHSVVLTQNAAIALSSFTGQLLSEAEGEILSRFANVFEQAYVRFLDLQKAEAQAREAQIQLALERIRARTMAMQRSDELAETATVLFEQFNALGSEPERISIVTINEKENVFEVWTTQHGGSKIDKLYKLSPDEPHVTQKLYAAWKAQTKSITIDLQGNELEEYFQFLKNAGVPVERDIFGNRRIQHAATFSKGILNIITPEPRPREMMDILERFAGVFDLTYTRFLDLQKAEAQAREAQIEAALERVRARTMAMHKSEELIEVIASVFQQLEQLNFRIDSANLFPNYKENPFKFWMAVPGYLYPAELDVPYGDFALMNRFIREIKSDATLVTAKFNQEEKNEWVRHLIKHTIVGNVTDEKKKQMFEAPGLAVSVIGIKNIAFAITNYSMQSYSDEENEILRRFVIVFDQTYTRFLDLQKAEAQAREAQIEAALERVRSRTTMMQKSEELREVIQMVFEQLRQLHFKIDSAHFNLNYKESDDYHLWSAAPGQPYPVKTYIPWFDHPAFIKAKEAKEKGLDFFTENYTQEEKNKFFEHLFKHAPIISEERKKYILSGQGVAASTVLMNTISLWVMNYAGVPYSDAENAILKRFGKVFEQTYTRFLDLQKAEAQAREVVKQAALDRIRADIASMRTVGDLDRITPLIWNELTTLGIPFIRCGVFIMDDAQKLSHTFLSTPDGKAIAAFHLPYNSSGNFTDVVDHWKEKTIYVGHWERSEFANQADRLAQQGAVASRDHYMNTLPHEGIHLHFLPFLQGMLYVGNTARLAEEQIELIQSVADAFSTAYARYEDFNKLEAAKQQVEKTLTELKQAQAQLIQSEKMASLGALTAGIAHEIQNPLNFVNNFSEVNDELISELVDEVDKGNLDEIKLIAKDIKENGEKINFHGKRADSIVKGMLQHSRTSTGVKEPTDINKLADEYLRLSYHGMRAKDKSFNAEFKTEFDETIGKINVVPQDIGRVLLNLFNNAFYAVNERCKEEGEGYKALVYVQTKKINDKIEISVSDNGNGIPQNIIDKIFQPFFTTKPTGQGTGLGLSLAYDIIRAHGGEIKVETKEGEGSEFIITLPAN